MSVARVTELISASTKSFEAAIQVGALVLNEVTSRSKSTRAIDEHTNQG